MRRTAHDVGFDQQPQAPVGAGTEPGPSRRGLYVSVTVKFAVAQVLAAGWLGVSVWLSLAWLRELAGAVPMVAAIVVVSLVAYLPGWLVAFLAVSLLLDRQPPLRRTHPAVPVTVLVAARNEADRIQETISYIARQDYPGPIEVLVVDNGSTDGTRAVAEAYATGQRVAASTSPAPARATPSTPAWPGWEPSWSSPWTPTRCCTRRPSASSWPASWTPRPTCRPSPGRCWPATAATTSGPACRNETTSWGSLR